ncbi:hypothetical protein ABZ532_04220 [Streptomyces sp. NPDC019396]|uniref:hypothetical protein n=1 Tax=Streptomyces sp. NPDC019396 TaxID=3154687 RepID=UPI0033FB7409
MSTTDHHHRDHRAPGRVLVVDPALGEQALTELHAPRCARRRVAFWSSSRSS